MVKMNYIELNNKHQTNIRGIITYDSETQFKWVDDELEYIILNKFRPVPRINGLHNERYEIDSLITKYNDRRMDSAAFLNSIRAIENGKALPYEYTSHYYFSNLKMQKSLLISGFGGMGKSHYVYYMDNLLSKHDILHLCVYGKFIDDITAIPWDDILAIAQKQEFVFILDAFNELCEVDQKNIISHLSDFIDCTHGRLFITYRTNAVKDDILGILSGIITNSYDFLGVEYDTTVDNLVLNYGLNVFEYEDILYTNNALWLKMLVKTASFLPEKNNLKSISSASYLIENYIKYTINKSAWLKTKKCVEWLYKNNSIEFTYEDINGIIDDAANYISIMLQLGFITTKNSKYLFSNESILNNLLSRYFIQDIQSHKGSEIKIISRFERRYSLHEQLILALFDYFKNDVSKALQIIENSILKYSIKDLSILQKTHIPIGCNCDFTKYISQNLSLPQIFETFGGFDNRPFNCSNYINAKLFSDPQEIIELSKYFSETSANRINKYLFNILMLLKHIDNDGSRLREYFWYALWSSCIPDEETRKIATKVLFEITLAYPSYLELLIDVYSKIKDDFIKTSIIISLALQSKKHERIITPFFTEILNDPNETNSFVLGYCYLYPTIQKCYIEFTKRNYYTEFVTTTPTDKLHHYLDAADSHQQMWIGFRPSYHSKEFDTYPHFLKAEKKVVQKWNKKTNNLFHCMLTGECNGLAGLEEKVGSKNPYPFSLDETIPSHELYSIFQGVFYEVMSEYQFIEDKDDSYIYGSFTKSFLSKVLLITSQRFFGSLMCNYFLNQLLNYPTKMNYVGFDIYKPLEYIYYDIISPISSFSKLSYGLKNKVYSVFNFIGEKDINWANNVKSARQHLLTLVNDGISYGGVEWLPIAVVTKISTHDINGSMINSDNCNLYITIDETYELDDSEKTRHFTIELDTAKISLIDYAEQNVDSQCMSVDCFSPNHKYDSESRLILPPPALIKELNLKFDFKKSEWVNMNGDTIIVCDNNKSNLYRANVQSIVMIKKSALEAVKIKHKIKYFAFTERYTLETGYQNQCDNHYQIENGRIVKEIPNTGNTYSEEKCLNCPFGFNEPQEESSEDFEEFLKIIGDYS